MLKNIDNLIFFTNTTFYLIFALTMLAFTMIIIRFPHKKVKNK